MFFFFRSERGDDDADIIIGDGSGIRDRGSSSSKLLSSRERKVCVDAEAHTAWSLAFQRTEKFMEGTGTFGNKAEETSCPRGLSPTEVAAMFESNTRQELKGLFALQLISNMRMKAATYITIKTCIIKVNLRCCVVNGKRQNVCYLLQIWKVKFECYVPVLLSIESALVQLCRTTCSGVRGTR